MIKFIFIFIVIILLFKIFNSSDKDQGLKKDLANLGKNIHYPEIHLNKPSIMDYQTDMYLKGYNKPNYTQDNIWLGTAKLQSATREDIM
jgi:hypothetical protein